MTAMPKPILFYDLASSLNTTTSVNTLKTKLNLTYKRISYETVWVALADVKAVSEEHGFAPTSTRPDGSPHYTLPAIRDQDTGKAVSESFEIAKYLDQQHAARPLIPSGTEAQQAAFVGALVATIGLEAHTIGIYTVYHALSEPSKTFYEGQMQAFGLNIATMEKKSPAEQQELISAALDRLAAALDAEGSTNEHFIGDSITFADLAAAAYVKWFMVISDEAEYVMTLNGGRWKRLLDEIKVQY